MPLLMNSARLTHFWQRRISSTLIAPFLRATATGTHKGFVVFGGNWRCFQNQHTLSTMEDGARETAVAIPGKTSYDAEKMSYSH